MMDDTTNLPTSIDTSDKAAHPRPFSRRSDGSQTPRWSKRDSNPQSPVARRGQAPRRQIFQEETRRHRINQDE